MHDSITIRCRIYGRQYLAQVSMLLCWKEYYAEDNGIDIVSFRRGERKDDRAQEYLRQWCGGEGVLYIGKAQEKARVLRTERRHRPATGTTYAWLVSSTAMVNHFYVYVVDDDFGPFFLKFRSYFPYNAKLCINGHEYLKRQLTKRGIEFEPLDNGVLRCADPAAMQRLADGLTAGEGHPLRYLDAAGRIRPHRGLRPAGCRTGFFEEVMRENLDLGRPDHVEFFDRRVSRRTPTRYRTRVITDGVIPSLHVDYKHSRIKQYHKQGRALRTETVINDTYDFDVGRRLKNLDDLKRIGFAANRRLIGVERLSHDATIGAETLAALHRPPHVDGQRAPTLRFGDPRGQALLAALLRFDLLPAGFRNRKLREAVAPLRGDVARRLQRRTDDLRPAPVAAAGADRADSAQSAVSTYRRRAVHRPGLTPHPGARSGPGLVGHARRGVDHATAGGSRRVRSRGRPPVGRTRAGRVTRGIELPADSPISNLTLL